MKKKTPAKITNEHTCSFCSFIKPSYMPTNKTGFYCELKNCEVEQSQRACPKYEKF